MSNYSTLYSTAQYPYSTLKTVNRVTIIIIIIIIICAYYDITVAHQYNTFKNENSKYPTQFNNQYTILYTIFNAVTTSSLYKKFPHQQSPKILSSED